MKFFIKNLKENIVTLTRKIGYHYFGENENTKETNFIRPLERSGYPRFHLYLKTDGESLMFSLHLDQKKPIYPVRSPSHRTRDGSRLGRLTSNGVYRGLPAHQGEYEGAIVENETKRIKQILQKT